MSASVHLEICVLGLCFLHVLALNPPQVSLKQGVARGFYDTTVNGRPFAAFLGIPYARPPIRKHRFKEALPAEPWTGVYNAAFEPPMCLQYDHVTYKTDFPVHGNEDCLYINVFTPQVPNGNMTHYDVIVFIHGGAFMFSSGFVYGPQKLLDKDIVFVTFNYRLGPLGFLSTEDDIVPGNMGLKDQTLALKWVKKNIAAFGGNPDSVTITGMSAGGSSVHYHMLSPLSKGLFNRVISVSGTALCPWAQTENAKEKAHMIASSLGCPVDNSTILVECLRNRPAKQILEATRMFMPWLYNPFSPFGPVVEKAGKRPFIDRSPIEIIKTGVISDVPLLMSFTLDEGLYPAAEIICTGDSLNELNKEWIKLAPYVLDYIHTVPPDQLNNVSKNIWIRYVGEKEEANLQEIIQMFGERLFIADIVKTAIIQAPMMTSPIYIYNFTYSGNVSLSDAFCKSKKKYGVSHGDDLAYIINMKFLSPVENDDKFMQDSMVELWTSFASNGVPKFGMFDNDWPKIKDHLPHLAFLNINSSTSNQVQVTENMDYLQFWESLGLHENINNVLNSQKDEL